MAKKSDATDGRFLISNGRLRGRIQPSVVVRSTEGSLASGNVKSRGSAETKAAVSKMLRTGKRR